MRLAAAHVYGRTQSARDRPRPPPAQPARAAAQRRCPRRRLRRLHTPRHAPAGPATRRSGRAAACRARPAGGSAGPGCRDGCRRDRGRAGGARGRLPLRNTPCDIPCPSMTGFGEPLRGHGVDRDAARDVNGPVGRVVLNRKDLVTSVLPTNPNRSIPCRSSLCLLLAGIRFLRVTSRTVAATEARIGRRLPRPGACCSPPRGFPAGPRLGSDPGAAAACLSLPGRGLDRIPARLLPVLVRAVAAAARSTTATATRIRPRPGEAPSHACRAVGAARGTTVGALGPPPDHGQCRSRETRRGP